MAGYVNVAILSFAFVFAALTLFASQGAKAEARKLMVFGDSLVAGYGLPEDQGFTAQLQDALDARGYGVAVINAGVSGDTSSGGLGRLEWALADEPDYVILELGANDALRAVDPAVTRENLDAMLSILAGRGIEVLLAGMLAPPNLGPEYGEAFNAIYPALAEKHGVALYPFFLEGVATQAALNQDDGIHPNAAGVAVIVEKIMPPLVELLGPPPAEADTGAWLPGEHRPEGHRHERHRPEGRAHG